MNPQELTKGSLFLRAVFGLTSQETKFKFLCQCDCSNLRELEEDDLCGAVRLLRAV